MTISIIGNGAIGNLLAYHCHNLALDYRVITRDAEALPLQITDIQGKTSRLQLPVSTLTSLASSELLIVPLKAYQIEDFICQFQPYSQANQTLVLLHNGMGTIEKVQTMLPELNLIAATTSYGGFKADKYHLHIKGRGESHFGWVKQNRDCPAQVIEQQLSKLLPPAHWHQDIRLALWFKLAVNAAINPLTALHQINNGALRAPEFQGQIKQLCAEISQVMQHSGFATDATTLLQNINKVIEATADNFSSMNRDVKARRRSEIDFINGYIIQQAAKFGLPCPENSALFEQVRSVERCYLN